LSVEKYLKVLGLSSQATDRDIKKAYWSLSKKYHPDINKSSDAKEKFLEINEAYHYLVESPIKEKEWIIGDNLEEERRNKARAYAWRKYQAEQKRQIQLMEKLLRYYTYSSFLIILTNILFLIDYTLPKQQENINIVSVDKVYENVGGIKYHTFDDIEFLNVTLRFDAGLIDYDHLYKEISVSRTAIWNKIISINLEEREIKPISNFYTINKFFSVVMIIIFSVFFFTSNSDAKLTLALTSIIGFFIQIILYFSY